MCRSVCWTHRHGRRFDYIDLVPASGGTIYIDIYDYLCLVAPRYLLFILSWNPGNRGDLPVVCGCLCSIINMWWSCSVISLVWHIYTHRLSVYSYRYCGIVYNYLYPTLIENNTILTQTIFVFGSTSCAQDWVCDAWYNAHIRSSSQISVVSLQRKTAILRSVIPIFHLYRVIYNYLSLNAIPLSQISRC